MKYTNHGMILRERSKRSALATASTLTLATASLAVGLTLTAGPALAAEQSRDRTNQVQEVVVTAQKRVQSLQKVPVSAQVLQGTALQEQNNNDLSDLTQTVPAVHIVNTGGPSNTLNIRGIGSGTGNPAFDESVAIFEDDIFHGRSHMTSEGFLDLDRVEVLKGPQSTFFGNNAIAGALNIVTKKPDDHFDGYARLLYGSYGRFAIEGAAGGPINDKLAIRVAADYNGVDGWIRNIDTGTFAPHERNAAGRFTAVFKPTSNLDVTLKIEGGSDDFSNGTGSIPFQLNCPTPGYLLAKSVNKFCPASITNGSPQGLYNNNDAGIPGQFANLTTNEDVLTINYHWAGLTFTSVTGESDYRFSSHKDGADIGTLAQTIALNALQSTNTPERYNQFSQEFRITSPVGRPIEYMVGVYYQTDNVNELIDGNATYLNNSLIAFVPSKLSPAQYSALAALLPVGYDIGYTQKETIESAFASLSWNTTDKLKFNLGLRGTSDKKDFVGSIAYGQETQTFGGFVADPAPVQSSLGFLLGVPGFYPYSRTDKAFMPSLGVQYQVNPSSMIYATATHGFKAGGYNAISPSLLTLPGGGTSPPTYNPEAVNAYEAGLKGKWFDNSLLLNVDVFREDYTNLQVNSLIQLVANNSIAVVNAASSRSQGVEVETQWVANRNFRLSADVTYLDAHYVSFPKASPTFLQGQGYTIPGAPPIVVPKVQSQNLSGEPTDFAPMWSASMTAEFRADLSDDYKLVADVTPFFQSSYFNSSGTDEAFTRIKSNLRLDAKVTLESLSKKWAIDLIGKNLTNRVIPVVQNATGGKEEPINVAVQVRYHW